MAFLWLALTLCLTSSKTWGLVKNCVSPDEWNGDTSDNPKCEVVLPHSDVSVKCYGGAGADDTEITVNRMPPDQQVASNTPMIVCNASYPIDVDQDGFKIKCQPNILFFRHQLNSSATVHSIVIPLYCIIWSPRWFIFKSIENPRLYTKFYLYYPGGNDRSLPYDWPNQKIYPTVIQPEERFAVLPCQVSHRSDVIVLTKNKCSTGEDTLVAVDNRTVRFVPRDGFVVDTWAELEDSVYGLYTCTAQNHRKPKNDLETLQVTLRRPKEFTAEPDIRKVYVFPGEKLELSCKSPRELHLEGNLNQRRILQGNFTYSNNPKDRSIYSAQFVYNASLGDIGEVTCKGDLDNSHTWAFVTLDATNNRHLQFESNYSEVKCASKMFSFVAIYNIECNNEAHCRSKKQAVDSFGAGQCDFKMSKVGFQCADTCVRHSLFRDRCFNVDDSLRSGVYKCETEDLSYKINYLVGYDRHLYTNLQNLSTFPPAAIIRVSNPEGVVYTNQNNTFYCQGSSFISNGPFNWTLKAPNGTQLEPNIVGVDAFHDFKTGNDSIWAATMVFYQALRRLQVICSVPIWNSRDGRLSNYVTVDVIRPTVPIIVSSESADQTYYVGDSNKFIPCNAIGQPTPTVQWFRNRVPVDSSMTEKDGKDLVFKEINDTVSGTYTCLATSPGGDVTKDFWVTVEDKPNVTVYVVMAVFLVVAFALIVMFLCWRLIKAKRRLRSLTDAEVRAFLLGDTEAVKSAKEPHQVFVHLPFLPEYEISRDRLEFSEHDVLGSGAYGIVYRGKLHGYPEDVAIKTLKSQSTLSYFKALLSELKIMIYLGKHENVIQLIGAYTGKIKERLLYMVVELSPYGNLESYLRNHAKNFQNQVKNDAVSTTIQLSPGFTQVYANVSLPTVDNPMYIPMLCTSDLVTFSHQIAEGMHHLATKKVIHADLACRNVLVYKDGLVKITDFGLSRQLYAYSSYMKKEQEPLPWRSMAIESLSEMTFSTQSDVWSYGVTLWEIFSLGAVPYPGLGWSMDFVQKLIHGLRLSKPTYATSQIYHVMLDCWLEEPSQRPSFEVLRKRFDKIRSTAENFSENG